MATSCGFKSHLPQAGKVLYLKRYRTFFRDTEKFILLLILFRLKRFQKVSVLQMEVPDVILIREKKLPQAR